MSEKRTTVRVAAAAYPIDQVGSWRGYEEKIRHWIEKAAQQGVDLAVLPEYAPLELASLLAPEIQQEAPRQLTAMQDLLPRYLDLMSRMAETFGLYLLGGTFPVRTGDGAFVNRAYLFDPSGDFDFQEKLTLTRYEDEELLLDTGREIKVFETSFGRVAVNICYDCEFPVYAHKQVEAGADLILVPSSTSSEAGFHRVRIGCQARALENQCYVVHAATVGDASWSAFLGETVGAGAVYGPADASFDADGVLAMGRLNEPGWVAADVDLAELDRLRRTGEQLNLRDWGTQDGFTDRLVATSALQARPQEQVLALPGDGQGR